MLLHYITGVGRGPGFFEINPLTGEISITNDLKNGNQPQYTVKFSKNIENIERANKRMIFIMCDNF